MKDTMTTAPRAARGERGDGVRGAAGRGHGGFAPPLALAAAVLGLSGALGADDLGEPRPAGAGQVDHAGPVELMGHQRPRARVDLGVGAGMHGFRLSVEGGEPGGQALLVLRPEGGPSTTQVVTLDGHGAAELTRRGWPGMRDLDAWFLLANKGAGGSTGTNQVTVPGAAAQTPVPAQRGDLLVNEFLKDPKSVADSAGEWVELWNATQRTVNIEGWWLLDDGGDQHMLYNQTQGIYVQPGQYFVLGRKADPALNGGVQVDYVYTGFSLSNGADEVRLVSRGGALIDEVRYDDGIFWPDESGKSVSLDPRRRAAHLNDDPVSWCHGQSAIGAGNPDLGSPGAKNQLCP